MTEEEYPGPRLIETSAPCPPLARLPKLPVRVLVLSREGDQGEERRRLASRLARLADELGVGAGVRVAAHSFTDWAHLGEGLEPGRYDAVFFSDTDLPGAYDDPSEPADGLLDALFLLLADSETRFIVLQPPSGGAVDRRDALCLRLADRGSPPAVVVPQGWAEGDADTFVETLFERILHDWPLARAVTDAAGHRTPRVTIFQPPGRRHGLDLGRLLENHRRRIEEGGSALRSFLRELEAARPEEESGPWHDIAGQASQRQEELDAVKADVEEINRDRDPAGWSRLVESIARLNRWEEGLERARAALEATRGAAP
ncbi:MAG: hypothetical protein KDA24_00845 [Deltaproteobacteria bacterium]|nr:hypothetical protein [Deltaproteobacteria bacterium]